MADNLHMLRSHLGLTQDEIAKIIGVSRHTVLSIENQSREMSWNTFLSLILLFTKNERTDKLMNILGIYTDELNDFLKLRGRVKVRQGAKNKAN
ncbi:MAG: helix-turn-helix domain-containing protein [Clostridia bacterium]